jgi:dihydrodipicolinate reductase
MVKLLIVGPNGAMGRALVKCAANTLNVDLIAGIGPKDRDYIGMDLGLLVGLGRQIGAIVADELGRDLDDVAEHGREDLGIRASDSLQFSAIRSGGTPSTHRVIFGFENERLELIHRVQSMDAFADGLIQAVLFVGDRQRGYFTLNDAL